MMKIQGRESFRNEFPKAAEELKKMGIERCLLNAEFKLAIHGAEHPGSSASLVSWVPDAHTSVMGLLGPSFPSGLVHWPLSLWKRRGEGEADSASVQEQWLWPLREVCGDLSWTIEGRRQLV